MAWKVEAADVNGEWPNSVSSQRLDTAVTAANRMMERYKARYPALVTDDDAEIMALWLAIHFAKADQPDLSALGDRQVTHPSIRSSLMETQEGRRLATFDPAGQIAAEGKPSASLKGFGPRDV